jgi:thioredoxin reductase (NADPH)
MMYDAIVLGKGPAGISASVYLARSGLSVLVVGKEIGALERAEHIENYYGFPEPVSGKELSARGIAQAERLGVAVVPEEVVGIGMEDSFTVKTQAAEYRARSVLVATGKQRSGLRVPGFEEFRGKGISFCATCDGFFHRGKKLAVVGTGEYAASELGELLHFSKDLTLFTDGGALVPGRFPDGIAVITDRIASFETAAPAGIDRLGSIVTVDAEGTKTAHQVDGAFIAIGTAGAADFAAKIGIELRGQDIAVDGNFMTNVPGIFAAGDCIGGFLQVAKAVSDGALAARGMIEFLKKR